MNMAHSPWESSFRTAGPGSRVSGSSAVNECGIRTNGSTRAVVVSRNERVLFGKSAGTEVTLNGEGAIVLHEEGIAAGLGH